MVTENNEEILKNYEAFKKINFSDEDNGKFALLHGGELIKTFKEALDANKKGEELYSHGNFSIQKIGVDEVDLGFMSYAMR